MKTTILGILTILVAVGNAAIQILNGDAIDYAATAASVTAGIGLLKAADAKSERILRQTDAKPE